MRNSRRDGLLIVRCDKPYKVAYKGNTVERYTVICRDINKRAEFIAFDFEQMLNVALVSLANDSQISETEEDKDQKTESEKFYDEENPSVSDVEKQAGTILLMINSNSKIKMSEFIKTFKGFLKCGLIRTEDDIQVNDHIWNSIDRNDKVKIMVNYMCFFVNPLQRLQNMSTTQKDKESVRDDLEEKSEMQLEQSMLPMEESDTPSTWT